MSFKPSGTTAIAAVIANISFAVDPCIRPRLPITANPDSTTAQSSYLYSTLGAVADEMQEQPNELDLESNQNDTDLDVLVPPNVSPQIQEQTNSATMHPKIDSVNSNTNWQNSEKKSVRRLAVRVDSLRMMHHLASTHYRARNLCFRLVPTLFLSLSSSVLSIYDASADKFVAILTAGIAFVEALNRFLEYESSEAMHLQAAAALSKIKTDCQILLAEVPKQNPQGAADGNSNKAKSTTEENDNSQYYWGKKKSVTDRFDMVQEAIDKPLPIKIEGAYELLTVHLTGNTKLRKNVHDSLNAVQHIENIETDAYSYASEVLFSVICSAYGWPLCLPGSTRSIKVLERRFETLHLRDDVK